MDEFIKNDPKGDKLKKFYYQLQERFKDIQDDILGHVHNTGSAIMVMIEQLNKQSSTLQKSSVGHPDESFPPEELVNEVTEQLNDLMTHHNTQINHKLEAHNPILCCRYKLKYVIFCIVKNAIEAMQNVPSHNRKVDIRSERTSEHTIISIKDRGKGMSDIELKDIFVQKDQWNSLHQCANYMVELKGRIWAEANSDGPGCTFFITLRI
ncbi:MAG: HAMP domain-containing histidine kinase, partial [Planctomycetes bacterium]|nr:HAMP domain-containing histidine kinase [Planctomycetota bacterium]